MTAYNSDRYISEAIKSILLQTFSNFEFIIIDDGSIDGTKERILSISDPRIRFFGIDHVGRSAALNYAVKQTTAPFVAFMDADDISMPDRLEKQYLAFQRYPHISVVSNWFEVIDEHGNKIKVVRMLPEFHQDIENGMTIHCSMCFSSSMIRRDILRQAGDFNEQFQIQSVEDYDIYLRLLPIATFYNIQEVLLQYRVRKDSLVATRTREQKLSRLQLANNYLHGQLQRARSKQEQCNIYLRYGLSEYYHGSMWAARYWFLRAMPMYWTTWKFWRYLVPTFLGNTMFGLYRKIFIGRF
jgi:glycosyltransferase involved in cell wall biosynthesis